MLAAARRGLSVACPPRRQLRHTEAAAVPYAFLADAVLVLHFAVVVFVVGGLPAIVVGRLRGWCWVDGWAFRLAHAGAIAVIVAQAWLGQHCPLTALESWLIGRAGATAPYEAGFVAHWITRLIYFEAPPWVFALAYSLFGLLVAAAWWRFPPRPRRVPRSGRPDASSRPGPGGRPRP